MVMAVRKYRFFLAALSFAAILLVIITGVFSIDNASNKMVIEYLSSLGWEIENVPVEISHLTIPKSFDAAYETYNAVQKECGFDLTPFRGKSVIRYSYRVLNHKRSGEAKVLASVFVYDGRIIAGDICSTDMDGFMHSVCETANIKTE